jgi:hypothetical protein
MTDFTLIDGGVIVIVEPPVIVDAWEATRAAAVAEKNRVALVAGIAGAETVAPAVSQSQYGDVAEAASREVRRMAYSLLGALDVQPPWQPLAYATGWEDYGGPWQTGAFMRDAFGRVWLRGLVRRVSGVGTLVATLPPGYVPAGNIVNPAFCDDAGVRVDVESDGSIHYQSTGPDPGNYLSLAGISFDLR